MFVALIMGFTSWRQPTIGFSLGGRCTIWGRVTNHYPLLSRPAATYALQQNPDLNTTNSIS